MNRVAVLAGPDALSKRIRAAFEQEWPRIGGEIVASRQLVRDVAEVKATITAASRE